MFIMLIAKHLPATNFNPHDMPPNMALEDWLADNFNIIGPLHKQQDTVEIADKLEDGRYWAVLEILDKVSA